MRHQEMQSLINSVVQKVQRSSGAGTDAAVEAVLRGLQEYVSEHEADLVEQVMDEEGEVRAQTQDEIRLFRHMYGVLDKAGSKLRYRPRRPKKRGRAKQQSTAKGGRMSAMRKAMRGT